jgi:carboxylesterase
MLSPYIDLSDIKDFELEVMDTKRAESEEVREPLNYPKYYRGGKTGVLLIHGFTGAPYEFLPLAEYLSGEGFSVYLARVAGHASDPVNLNILTYEDWYESLKYGYWLLRKNCERVMVAGQSMGSLLAVNLVLNNKADGLVLFAPCIKVKNRLNPLVPLVMKFKNFSGKRFNGEDLDYFYNAYPLKGVHQLNLLMKLTRPLAEKIDIPVLVFQHEGDKIVSAEAAADFFRRISSEKKTMRIFEKDPSGYHALCGENNPHRQSMFEEIKEWIYAFER